MEVWLASIRPDTRWAVCGGAGGGSDRHSGDERNGARGEACSGGLDVGGRMWVRGRKRWKGWQCKEKGAGGRQLWYGDSSPVHREQASA